MPSPRKPAGKSAQKASDITTLLGELTDVVLNELQSQSQQLKEISMKLDDLIAKLKAESDQLVAAVARANTLEQGVETLLNGQSAQLAALRAQVAALQTASTDIDPTQIQPILDTIDAQQTANASIQDKLAAALSANTQQQ